MFEVAMAQRAGLLDIQPFLQTARMKEMTARGDHSRLHVLITDSTDIVVLLKLLFRGNR